MSLGQSLGLKRKGFSPYMNTLFGAAAAGKSEGAAAFRLLNSAHFIEAALAAGRFAANFPREPEFSSSHLSPYANRAKIFAGLSP
jgi:hypothetical protein